MVRKIPIDRWQRYRLLLKELKQYQSKRFYCKSLTCFVKVTSNSITETAHHASKSMISTKLAIRLPYVIKNAKVFEPYIPTKLNGKQVKTMKFQYLILLTCGIRKLGTALLTVGKRKSGDVYEYCITDFRLYTNKKE